MLKLLFGTIALAMASASAPLAETTDAWSVETPTCVAPDATFGIIPDANLYALPETMAFAVMGSNVLLVHPTGASTLVAISDVVIVSGSPPNAWGFPALATPQLPHVFETSYSSRVGDHTVRTPCAAYTGLTACAQAHRAAVLALQVVFPPQ